jgi:CHASE3 domain sensor protein
VKRPGYNLFGAAVCCTLLLAVILYVTFLHCQEATHWREHTYQVLDALDDCLRGLVDAETGQRGYLLTLEPSYLAPYHQGDRDAVAAWERALALTQDNHEQQQRLSDLWPVLNAKRKELQQTVQLAQSHQEEEALHLVRSHHGKNLMDDVRRRLADIRTAEEQLLAERSHWAALGASWMVGVIVVGGLVVAALVTLAGIAARGTTRVAAYYGTREKEEGQP